MTRTFVHDADVRTLDDSCPRATSIAWEGDRILAVGSRKELSALRREGDLELDVDGATVVPGFVDAHHHPAIVALYGSSLKLAPPAVTDLPSLAHALSAKSKTLAEGEWLVATDWDELLLRERRPPTADELEEAVPDRPAFLLHYSCHRAVANRRALELAGIDRASPDRGGGSIERTKDGTPTGLLIERGMSRVEELARRSLVSRDEVGFFARLAAHHRALAEHGITLVVDATVPPDLEALYREAERRGILSIRTVMLPVSIRGWLEAPVDVLDAPPDSGESPLLRRGPVKLVFDGAPQCAMCLGWLQTAGVLLRALAMSAERGNFDALRASLSVTPRLGREIRTGVSIYDADEARAVVAKAADRGFSVATHAIGNAAVDVALDAYAAAGERLTRAGRPRLEHAIFIDRAQVSRIADLGAAVVTQPVMLGLPAFSSAPSIPNVGTFPLRWLLDAGVLVAGSSDFPVATFAPLAGIQAAVRRQTAHREPFEPEQSVSLDEALAMHTRAGAEVAGELSQTGTITPGKRADLVILDRRLDERSLDGARVRATVAAGDWVYGSPTEWVTGTT